MNITSKSSIVIPFPDQKAAISTAQRRAFHAKRFAWIERISLDRNITHLASRVAVRIGMKYLNPTSGDAWMKQSTLAEELGVTVRAIQKSLDALDDAGHLHRDVVHGRSLSNHYRPELGTKNTNAGSGFASSKDEQVFALKTPKTRTREQKNMNERSKKPEPPFVQSLLREPSKENPVKKEDISANQNGSGRTAIVKHSGSNPDFESFWQAYPKRVGRLKAEKNYAAAVSSGIPAEVLLAGAGRYAAERAGQDPQFTKHPSTWLNGGCWDDEPQVPSKTATKSFDAFVVGARGFLNGGSHDE